MCRHTESNRVDFCFTYSNVFVVIAFCGVVACVWSAFGTLACGERDTETLSQRFCSIPIVCASLERTHNMHKLPFLFTVPPVVSPRSSGVPVVTLSPRVPPPVVSPVCSSFNSLFPFYCCSSCSFLLSYGSSSSLSPSVPDCPVGPSDPLGCCLCLSPCLCAVRNN